MFRICLVSMPFAAIHTPSLGLTRLRSVLEDKLGSQVSVEIHYLNLEVARVLGRDLYTQIAESVSAHNNGLGEWFFRRLAFSQVEDNADPYFRRYYPRTDPETLSLKDAILDGREKAEALIPKLILDLGLHQAQLVGLTSLFLQNTASFALARLLKQQNPDVVTVMGGANCETPMGEEIVRHVPWLDFVFSGSALITLPQVVEALLRQDRDAVQSISGVFTRENTKNDRNPGPVGQELSIEAAIDLDYGSYLDALEATFPHHAKPRLLFETSRGCWWGEKLQCVFCGLNGTDMPHRGMSPSRARQELDNLLQYYPRSRYFEAVDNLLPGDYATKLFPHFHPPDDLTIFYEVKANLSEEELEALSRGGVRRMQAGIEALSSQTLKIIRKGTSSFQNLTFLKNCLRFKIEAVWNLLVGFPGEEEDTYRKYAEDLPRLFHLPPPTGIYPVRYDRYSPYFVDPQSFGLKLEPFDFYSLVYPFPPESLRNLAYHFVDLNTQAPHFEALLRWLEPLGAIIDVWTQRWSARTPPRLCFVDGGVYDSRAEKPQLHELGENSLAMLNEMLRPLRLDVLAHRLEHLSDLDVEAEMTVLAEKGLVFRDGRQYLSLVLPKHGNPVSQPELRARSRRRRRVSRASLDN